MTFFSFWLTSGFSFGAFSFVCGSLLIEDASHGERKNISGCNWCMTGHSLESSGADYDRLVVVGYRRI